MIEISELRAKYMNLQELAEALRDHQDAAVRELARKVIESNSDGDE